MAERFPDFQVEEIQDDDDVWTSWAESKNFEINLLSYDAKQLDDTLQKFFAEIREKDGSEYEPDSLRVIWRHWTDPERKGCCLLNSQGYRVFQQQKST